jgi:hypothetical protein
MPTHKILKLNVLSGVRGVSGQTRRVTRYTLAQTLDPDLVQVCTWAHRLSWNGAQTPVHTLIRN